MVSPTAHHLCESRKLTTTNYQHSLGERKFKSYIRSKPADGDQDTELSYNLTDVTLRIPKRKPSQERRTAGRNLQDHAQLCKLLRPGARLVAGNSLLGIHKAKAIKKVSIKTV
jgi:hypothetical protein